MPSGDNLFDLIMTLQVSSSVGVGVIDLGVDPSDDHKVGIEDSIYILQQASESGQ